MSKCEIDNWGNKRWYNEKGEYHREDGPAIECKTYMAYYINGKFHRVDGPAIEWTDGSKVYYINDNLHRIDGPAVESASGNNFYYINDKPISEEEFLSPEFRMKLMLEN